jgi:crotonobetainyl-CoA:carnitine CoA-transferase CaiB-like acyl-CoA transferase
LSDADKAPPLAGVRVLDLSRVLAGPWASQTLADLGADVIKIERPGSGDDTRAWGPPYLRDSEGRETSESAYFLAANRGKKSVTIDIATTEGQKLAAALAEHADVVIENFKAGQLAKYGLDAAALRNLNPRLIYCSITGFGQTGPYRDLPGYDFLIQGIGGLMSLTGEATGAPMKTGVAIADLFAGMYAAVAILAALNRRQATGHGETIDISLLDCQVAMLANQAMNFLTTGVAPHRRGNAHPNIVPYEAFATSDGHIIVAVGNDAQFAAFSKALESDQWARDERFATNPARVRNRELLIPLIATALLGRSTTAWLTSLADANVPAGPINTLDQVFADPQVQARGLAQSLPHPSGGAAPTVVSPIRYADAALAEPTAPPSIGQHTDAALAAWLSLPPDAIAALRVKGVI